MGAHALGPARAGAVGVLVLYLRMKERDLISEFDSLIKYTLAPFFKEHGFKKSGNNFYRVTDELIQTFNIQKSSWNSKDEISFTGNIGLLVPKTYLKLYKAEQLPRFPKVTDSIIQVRIGYLAGNTDHWYRLAVNTSFEHIRNNLEKDLIAVDDFFKGYQTISSLEPLVQNVKNINLLWSELGQYALYKELGKDKIAAELIREVYAKVLKTRIWHTEVLKIGDVWEEKSSEPKVNSYWVERIEQVASIYNDKIL